MIGNVFLFDNGSNVRNGNGNIERWKMTREEHISNLKTIGWDGWNVTSDAYDSIQFAIETLEQQNVLFKSGLLKDCEVCRAEQEHILDKIRAKIVKKHLSIVEKNGFDSGRTYGYEEALGIIDKYKAEMESEE